MHFQIYRLFLLALVLNHEYGFVISEVTEYSEPVRCQKDDGSYLFMDETCAVRDVPFSCSRSWKGRPCKCDDDCFLFDDCCPDTEDTVPLYNDLFPIPDALPEKMAWELDGSYLPYMTCEEHQIEWFYYPKNFTTPANYYLIGMCPNYVPWGSKIRHYCEDLPPSDDYIFLTPITMSSIGHFKNIFCAMCHGISLVDIQPWVWRWRCRIEASDDVSSDSHVPVYTEEYLVSLKSCSRALEPPDGSPENITPRPCFPGVDVRMCAPSYSSDSTTQLICPPYLAPVKHDGLIYKNLACAYCKGVDVCHINSTELCNSVDVPTLVQNTHLPSLADYFAFNPDDHIFLSCAHNEAFDPITGACQVVYCLSGFAFNRTTGACERLPVDEVGRVCLSFGSGLTGWIDANNTSSEIEYLVEAMNNLMIAMSYDVLASSVVLETSDISCSAFEIETYESERCNKENTTLSCQTCFDIELNFTAIMTSNLSLSMSNMSVVIMDDDLCFFSTPMFGNISIKNMTIDVPADWTCASYSSYFSGQTNDTLMPPFKVHINRESEAYRFTTVSGDYVCREYVTLICERYLMAHPGDFQSTLSNDGEEAISLGTGVVGEGEFQIMSNGSVLYCHEDPTSSSRVRPPGLDIMTFVGTILSILSVLVVIITYTVFPILRNMAGKSILSLSVALFVTFLLMCLGAVSSTSKTFCKAMAAATHFSWLSIFFWMNALAIDLNRTFGTRAKIRVGSKSQIFYVWYSLYAWGVPALIVGACLTIDLCACTSLNFEYDSDGLCWLSRGDANLYGFGVPLAALLVLNTILFSDTVVGIRLTKKASERALKEKPALVRAKEELSLYIKLSCVMGFTWIFAFVCDYVNVPELWYVFTAVNSLQGVFILFAFGLNRRVTALWREKLGIKQKGGKSSQSDTKSTNAQSSSKI